MRVCVKGWGRSYFCCAQNISIQLVFKKKSWEWRKEGGAVAVISLMEGGGSGEVLRDCFLQRGKCAVLIVGGTHPRVNHSTESCQSP